MSGSCRVHTIGFHANKVATRERDWIVVYRQTSHNVDIVVFL